MSLVNTMLRNLDARAAMPEPGLAPHLDIHAVQRKPPGLRYSYIGLALIGMVVLLAAAYFILQPKPARPPAPLVIAAVGTVADSASDAAVVEEPAAPPAAALPASVSPDLPVTKAARPVTPNLPTASARPLASAPQRVASAASSTKPIPSAQSTPATLAPVRVAEAVTVEVSVVSSADRLTGEVSRAADLQRRGDLPAAEARLRNVLAEDPGHLGARLALVSLLARQQRYEEQQSVFQQGLERTPIEPRLLLPYARLLGAQGQWEPAAAALGKASDPLATNAEYRALNATVQQQLGRHDQAISEYRAALQLSPAVGAWWIGLALALESDGKPLEARNAWLQARQRSLTPDLAHFVDTRLARSGPEGGNTAY